MQYSPKLKKAMAQIKDILKEHDIAGFVVIHTPGFSEYLNHLETSYSCAKMAHDGTGIHVRMRAADYPPGQAEVVANGTFSMIHHLATNIAGHAEVYMDTEEGLAKKWNPDYLEGGGHTGEVDQNN